MIRRAVERMVRTSRRDRGPDDRGRSHRWDGRTQVRVRTKEMSHGEIPADDTRGTTNSNGMNTNINK